MNETNIRKYAGLLQEFGLTGLEITEDNKKIRLERATSMTVATAASDIPAINMEEKTEENTEYISIKSPMVGVFYAAPAENADPFVSVGDSVKKGDSLCIIEAMKLMNEIPSEVDGTISEICVSNGQIVEYGTELFRIRRA